jgi:transcription initiation factor TFIIIB Brf1 subunit/transcription initiation factor TFIIB
MSLLFPSCRGNAVGSTGVGGGVGAGAGAGGGAAASDGLGAAAAANLAALEEAWASLKPTTTAAASWMFRDGHICPDCMSDKGITMEEEAVVCTRCGTHLGYLIDSSAEYRWFGAEDRSPDPSRVGNPLNPLLPESSLGTRILTRPGDGRAMRRIRQYHMWNIMPYRERTLWTVFEGLQVRACNAGISMAIVEEAKQLYAQVSPRCICRGQQKDALLAACLFESLKRHDTPRRPADLAAIFQIDVKLITKGVKQFSGLLEEHLHTATKAAAAATTAPTAPVAATVAEVVESPVLPTKASSAAAATATTTVATTVAAAVAAAAAVTAPPTSFKHYLEPAIARLETPRALHGNILEFAARMGDTIDELGICPETTPSSLAASALALTCEKFSLSKSNAEVAKVCSISAATLQKCLKRIDAWRPVLFKE